MFGHGQLHITLSRGVFVSTTILLVQDGKLGKRTRVFTKNVVYKDAYYLSDMHSLRFVPFSVLEFSIHHFHINIF